MKRTELFDKILSKIYDDQNSFLVTNVWAERKFGITDENLIESIVDEMIEQKWVLPKKDNKFSVMIKNDGKQMIKKYGSYSSFERSINRSNKWTTAGKNIKIIFSFIVGIAIIYGSVVTYLNLQKDKKIDSQQTEIKQLNGKIDSLKTELNKRTTTTAIIQRGDSTVTKNINNN